MTGDASLDDAEERFQSAFLHAPTGMALCTVHGDLEEANESLARLLGRTIDDLLSHSLFDVTHDEDLRVAHNAWAKMRRSGAYLTRQAVRFRHADGSIVHVVLSASRVDDRDGSIRHLVVHVEDVTHRVALETALQHQALHDPLTGLPNRTLFVRRLTDVSTRRRSTDARVGVLFVDLDRFKAINDNYGHVVGDAVLVAVAARLGALLRPGDTVARFGGDEFVLLCQNVGLVEATRIAERIAVAIEEEVTVGGLRLPVTASIGIAVRGQDDDPPEWLIREADMAMYRAKAEGRARIEAFPLADGTRPG